MLRRRVVRYERGGTPDQLGGSQQGQLTDAVNDPLRRDTQLDLRRRGKVVPRADHRYVKVICHQCTKLTIAGPLLRRPGAAWRERNEPSRTIPEQSIHGSDVFTRREQARPDCSAREIGRGRRNARIGE
jgi:hypothetical protein